MLSADLDCLDLDLHDRYSTTEGQIWLNGLGAIARLPLDQARIDQQAGLNTSGFISGYRGSPLGGLDQELGQVQSELHANNVIFHPAINEDLAATAIWGTQQVNLLHKPKYDGVFGMWYGKAPGLDRSTDAIRHATMAGTYAKGGVLAMVGDDPACQSSTLPSFSGGVLRDLKIPALDPANISDILEFGLYGWALSRFCGSWVGMLTQSALVDAATTIDAEVAKTAFHIPDHDLSPHIRLPDTPFDQEKRIEEKHDLIRLFQQHNPINRVFGRRENAKLSIFASGLTYTNLRQALYVLGFKTEEALDRAGIQVIKLGLIWPLERNWIRSTLNTSKYIFVVENKQEFLENELKSILYGQSQGLIVGKLDRNEQPLLSSLKDLRTSDITVGLQRVFGDSDIAPPETDYLDRIQPSTIQSRQTVAAEDRKPLFCSGCPHATSTKIPEGSMALAGIGCHYMVQWMDRNTYTFTHMGGEGMNWVGQAPFTDTKHMFVNLGDGTYQHSGLMAIRGAVASGVNVTYKILFNDVVAMTGGQTLDGALTVPDVVNQVRAEGVQDVVVVSREPEKYTNVSFDVEERDQLVSVQRRFREVLGVTVLIYDQTCSNELRRRRSRKLVEPSRRHVFINHAVCEGCGDCTDKSLCNAIEPLETSLGTKRQINQTMCNQDLSCLQGYCPALVEVHGFKKKRDQSTALLGEAPAFLEKLNDEVAVPDAANIVIAGVGGTGIITLSRILSCAAWIEGKLANSLDQSGLAQKGGAVMAHIRIHPTMLHHTYVPEGNVDVLIGADPVTAASAQSLSLISPERCKAVLNQAVLPSMRSVIEGKTEFQSTSLIEKLTELTSELEAIDGNKTTEWLTGTSTATNMLLLGYAWQKGWIPLKRESILHAIDLNQTGKKTNQLVFEAGRAAAEGLLDIEQKSDPVEQFSYEDLLAEYSGPDLRNRYLNKLSEIRTLQRQRLDFCQRISAAAATTYFKVLYRKDEFEVARLLLQDRFQSEIAEHIESGFRIQYSFGSPWLTRLTGKEKVSIGSWFRPVLRLLAAMKGLRDSPFNPFRFSVERKLDQVILEAYEGDLQTVAAILHDDAQNLSDIIVDKMVDLLLAYEGVKGYGRVRQANWDIVNPNLETLRQQLRDSLVVGDATYDQKVRVLSS